MKFEKRFGTQTIGILATVSCIGACIAACAGSVAHADSDLEYTLDGVPGSVVCNTKNNLITVKYRLTKMIKSENSEMRATRVITEIVSADTLPKHPGEKTGDVCTRYVTENQEHGPSLTIRSGDPRLAKIRAAYDAVMAGKSPPPVIGRATKYHPKRIVHEIHCNPADGSGDIELTQQDSSDESIEPPVHVLPGYGCQKLEQKLRPGSLVDIREEDGHFAAYRLHHEHVAAQAVTDRKDDAAKLGAVMGGSSDGSDGDLHARAPGADIGQQVQGAKEAKDAQAASGSAEFVPDGIKSDPDHQSRD
jgi:hypothetical protein